MQSLIPHQLDLSQGVSLYVHVPFCTKKCPYCHFFVVKDKQEQHLRFKDTLLKEWEIRKSSLSNRPLRSLYLGGGTPSLLEPGHLRSISHGLLKGLALSDDFELTLEVNPESYTLEKALAWKEIGINRLSIGVQSFSDSLLKALGRTHTSHQARKVIEELNGLGFDNISIDLMLETPGQTESDIETTLKVVRDLPISHLSLYNMTFEEGSLFHRKQKALKPLIPPDEENLSIYKKVIQSLEECGFERYEISAFCKEKKISVHNTGYWLSRPFLGLGPSAFSFLDGMRTENAPNLHLWEEMVSAGKLPISLIDEIPASLRYKEQFLIALRILSGVDLPAWIEKFGDLPLELAMSLKEAKRLGWIDQIGDRVKLSSEGVLFYDSLGALCI